MKKHLIHLLLIFTITLSACKHNDQDSSTIQTIPVTGLFSLTGDWSDLGITSKAAVELAIEEVNTDFANRGLPYRFSFNVYDTKLDPAIAASKISSVIANGSRLIIGPQSSAEVGSIKNLADSLGLLVVSQGSTASSLAIANDAVFRLCPGDQIEGSAMASTMYTNNKRALITLARNDAGNLGLQTSVTSHFQALGGTVASAGNYATNQTDFTASLGAIRSNIISLSSNYSSNQIAVYLASFDEAVQLFHQAAGDPVLEGVNWYGGDGFIKSTTLLNDPLAAGFCFTTSFFSPEFGLATSAQNVWQPVVTKITSRCGQQPDAFSLAAYDALKVLAKMIEANKGVPAGGTALQTTFFNCANNYNGIDGMLMLNSNGDRDNGSFDYWGLTNNNGTYNWTVVGQSQ